MLLLKQDTTKKGRVDEITQLEFEMDDDKHYEVERIRDSAMYAMESKAGHLLRLYYLVDWKDYPEEESMWEPAFVIQHLQKLLSKFYWENSTKPTATSPLVNSIGPLSSPAGPPNKSKAG